MKGVIFNLFSDTIESSSLSSVDLCTISPATYDELFEIWREIYSMFFSNIAYWLISVLAILLKIDRSYQYKESLLLLKIRLDRSATT